MRKKSLTDPKMSAVEYVERAAWLSRELTRMKARGPGDLENAMRMIERTYAIDYWVIWRLRYRLSQIRDVGASVLARLEEAYRAECERQHARLTHELEITRKICGPSHKAVVAAAAVVGEAARENEARPSNAADLPADSSEGSA